MNWKQNLYRVITSAIKSKPHKIYSLIAKMFLSRILKLIKKQICVELWREGTDHVYSACKCCNHADHAPNDLSEWIKFRTLQLVSVSCFCYVSALLHICLVWVIQIPKRMVFYLFCLWARELKLVSFLPNFDVIRTKEAEMEPVYKTCFGRGIT